MTMHQPLPAAPQKATRVQFMAEDDKAMLRAVRDLTKGLGQARPGIYWADMLLSAGIAVCVSRLRFPELLLLEPKSAAMDSPKSVARANRG